MSSAISSMPSRSPSSSMSSTAAASRGKPQAMLSSMALMVRLSTISRVAGTSPAATMADTTLPAVFERVAHGEQGLDRLRLAEDAKNGGGRYPQGPFAAHEGAGQIQAEGIGILATQPDDLAAGEHYLQPEHVIGRDPVLEAMRSARVLGDVAAQRAGLLAGRVGGVVVAERGEDRGDVEIEDAHLHGHALIGDVDLEHLVHAAHLEDHGAVQGQRAAAEVGAAAPGHERDAFLGEDLEHRRDLLGRLARTPPRAAPTARGRRRIRRSGDRRAGRARSSARRWPAARSAAKRVELRHAETPCCHGSTLPAPDILPECVLTAGEPVGVAGACRPSGGQRTCQDQISASTATSIPSPVS